MKQSLKTFSVVSFFLISGFVGSSCNNDAPLNKQEETAVEEQLKKDQEAMDSLEQAINALMDSTGNIEENDSL
jgi:hypothetical protein